MRKILLYTAISIDDFIARKDGSIDWLHNPDIIPEGEDFGYSDFYSSIDTTLMGNKTYKQILGFGGSFPYPDKKNYVITHEAGLAHTAYVKFISSDIENFCQNLKKEEGSNIWLIGGGQINSILLEADLVDHLILTKIPVPLGSGIPIFSQDDWKDKFQTSSSKMYKNGIVQLKMDKK
jgi:dihydrofolate reductase